MTITVMAITIQNIKTDVNMDNNAFYDSQTPNSFYKHESIPSYSLKLKHPFLNHQCGFVNQQCSFTNHQCSFSKSHR